MTLFVTSTAFGASPTISSVTQQANTLSVAGFSFGTKPTTTPFYYSNFDSETTGQMPVGQISNLTAGNQGTVQTNKVRSGSKSLEFNYSAIAGSSKENWKRNAIDLGAGGADNIYLSTWIYVDKGTSTCTSWQWKNFIVTSESNLYFALNNSGATTLGFESWVYTNDRWGNTGSPYNYYWDFVTSKSIGSYSSTAPSDLFLWNQWQKVELYLQRSSSGGVADGKIYFNRIGRSSAIVNKTDAKTHVSGDNPWRYVDLSNGIASVVDGYVNFNVYMDDVYVDTTQARVELCDSSTWSARTHCEIQPTTAWTADGSQIKANYNPGSFSNGQTAYVYVVDSNGAVSNGKSIIINSTGSTLKPPTNPIGKLTTTTP